MMSANREKASSIRIRVTTKRLNNLNVHTYYLHLSHKDCELLFFFTVQHTYVLFHLSIDGNATLRVHKSNKLVYVEPISKTQPSQHFMTCLSILTSAPNP